MHVWDDAIVSALRQRLPALTAGGPQPARLRIAGLTHGW